MTMSHIGSVPDQPVLLFDGTCAVCRRLAHWVQKSACGKSGEVTLVVRPVGDNPEELRSLNPNLDIWEAYKTVHVVMPNGAMKLGGEAIAEVLRRLPKAAWFARIFSVHLFGYRPFQKLLDGAYVVLEDVRPLLGCESCGTPRPWVGRLGWLMRLPSAIFGASRHPNATPHVTPRHAIMPRK
jgi:predicted DCC family thiol-disulfide oxidoreductase YuxK